MKRWIGLLLAVICLAALLCGCAGKTDANGTAGEGQTPTSTVPALPECKLKVTQQGKEDKGNRKPSGTSQEYDIAEQAELVFVCESNAELKFSLSDVTDYSVTVKLTNGAAVYDGKSLGSTEFSLMQGRSVKVRLGTDDDAELFSFSLTDGKTE